MSTAIAWALAAALEGLMAFGYETGQLRLLEAALWAWVLGVHLVELGARSTATGRFQAAASCVALGLYLGLLKGPELWYSMPVEYARSRRAELFSFDLAGVPLGLFGAALLMTPSAVVLSRWLGSEDESRSRGGQLVGRGVGFLYWGVTLLGCLRYGAGELLP